MSKFHSIIGSVKLDESYFGASRIKGNKVKLKRGRGTSKQPVFALFRYAHKKPATVWHRFACFTPLTLFVTALFVSTETCRTALLPLRLFSQKPASASPRTASLVLTNFLLRKNWYDNN